MIQIHPKLIIPLLFLSLGFSLFFGSPLQAKGNFDKLVISGDALATTLEVTNPELLGFFSFSDFSKDGIEPPPHIIIEAYKVERGWIENGLFVPWDRLHYYPDPAGAGGYIFYDGLINGGSEYDRQWYKASPGSDAALRRLLNLPGAAQAAATPEPVSSTTVIDFLPGLPAESKSGSCFTTSLVTSIASAYRCSTDTPDANGANLFDPCLIAADGKTLVCGADPTSGDLGFALNLTEALPTPEPLPTPKTSGHVLTAEVLANTEYLVPDWIESGKAKLTNGEFRQKYGDAELSVKLLSTYTAFGDLNGDGLEDAATIFIVNTGGSGGFVYLAAVLNSDGQPDNVAVSLLGDRVKINSLTIFGIEVGRIVVNLIAKGPHDPGCCPTERATWTYELQNQNLVNLPDNVWLLQLANGATCYFATGATAIIQDKRLNYDCSDGSSILGDLQPDGLVWQAEVVAEQDLVSTDTGFEAKQTTLADVAAIWRPVNPAAVVEQIGLSPAGVTLDLGSIARNLKSQIRPRIPYDPNVPPALNGEPAHLKFTFDEDTASPWLDTRQRQLLIYPVDAYHSMYGFAGVDELSQRMDTLQTLLQERPPQVSTELPVLPDIGASQVMHAQVKYLDFKGGSGVRFITHYAQDVSPILNSSIFYTFQGLTDDGRFYVAYFQPISTPLLPNTLAEAGAQDYDAFAQKFESYLAQTTQALNGARPGDFTPDLSQIDKMLESLLIQAPVN